MLALALAPPSSGTEGCVLHTAYTQLTEILGRGNGPGRALL